MIQQFAKIVFGCCLLFFVFQNSNFVMPSERLFEKVNISNVVFAVFLMVVAFFLKYQRLVYIVGLSNFSENNWSFKVTMNAHAVSSVLGIILPFKLGDISRVVLLNRTAKSLPLAFSFVFIERTLDLFVIFIFLLLLAFLYGYFDYIYVFNATNILMLFFTVTLFLMLFLGSLKFIYQIATIKSLNIAVKYCVVYENSIRFINRGYLMLKPNLFAIIIISFSIWILEVSSFVLLFSFWEVSLSAKALIAVISLLAFALPSGPAGLGVVQLSILSVIGAGVVRGSNVNSTDGIIHTFMLYIPFVSLLLLGILFVFLLRKSRG